MLCIISHQENELTYVGYKTETWRHGQTTVLWSPEGRVVVGGKGGQICGDGRQFDFGWLAHKATCRS